MRGKGAWSDYLPVAWRAILDHRLRSLLTMLGVIIGVASALLLISIVQGVKAEVTQQIEQFGANLLFVVPGRVDATQPFNPMSILGISTLTREDVRAVERVSGVKRALPIMFIAGGARNGDRWAATAIVLATEPAWQYIRNTPLAEGRFFTPQEAGERVCVLAHGVKRELFGEATALGKQVVINRVPFRVVGVLQPDDSSSSFGNMGWDYLIYLPLDAAQRAMRSDQIHRIVVQAVPGVEPDSLIEKVREAVRQSHLGNEDFTILTQKDLLRLIYSVLNLLQIALAGISSISLLVGGVGIMNIMLVSVTERTREIGIRKATGARQRDIFWQFLTEAVILSLTGGVLGILLAVAAAEIFRHTTVLQPQVTLGAVALAFGVSVLVGIAFGVAPAIRAARKEPIEALRYE
ncbi:MAG: ABC transporter permease [Armatimonadota bacterium]|nr:ABC transporter permease [bacterium]MCS7309902.1 ABC transporter permease [Armatimonadota bacterium]MDW8104086.1 ABC transporter permease [Armatimonadota bacterium]MDW8289703.1 ABC transporter permease [Armatimonadota bacterium]